MDNKITIESIIEDCIMEKLKPYEERIAMLESQLNDPKAGEIVEEYMPLSYFIKKYKRSRETLRKVRKQYGHIQEIKLLGERRFSVLQMAKAVEQYKPIKPSFKPRHKREKPIA